MANIGTDIPVAGGGGGGGAVELLLTQILAKLTGAKRPIELIEAVASGNTPDNVQNVSIFFDGNGGTLNGVSVPNGYVQSFAPNKGDDTVEAQAFTVPSSNPGGTPRVLIGYVELA